MNSANLIQQEATDFLVFVTEVHALYIDALQGFEHNRLSALEQQYRYGNNFLKQGHGVSIEELDLGTWEYNFNSEGKDIRVQHRTTIGDFKNRNGLGGSNAQLIAQLSIVTIYNYWDDHYRQRFALALNISKDNVIIPIMGDLRYHRNSIIHHRGIALEDITKCTEITWFNPGEPIILSPYQIEQIIQKVIKGIEDFVNQHQTNNFH